MGIAKLYGQKTSGANINGVIKECQVYKGENVNPGDLVEFVDETTVRKTTTSQFDGVAKNVAPNGNVKVYTL